MNKSQYDVIIVGGGLAGLSSAAYLAHNGKKVAVIERGKLGGRAMTIKMKGFQFNFGAHAIYGRDQSYLTKLEKELDLKLYWSDFTQMKAKYDLDDEVSVVPSNIGGLLQTKLLKGMDKFRFAYHILFTTLGFEKGDPDVSIKEWLDNKKVSPAVKEMMLNLAASNFFTGEPERIPSDVFFGYYKRLFKTNIPVSYIQGGWEKLINEFVRVIEQNGGEIITKTKVTGLEVNKNKIQKVYTKKNSYAAENFIFAIPPDELTSLFTETSIEKDLERYTDYEPTYVIFYDIGLKKRIDSSFTYIYDKAKQIFISDISYYDMEAAPPGGQLLQAVAYLKRDDINSPSAHERIIKEIEDFYDKHFEGWRKQLVVPRVSKVAVVQAIKWTMHQRGLPTSFSTLDNTFFAGDWCQGVGQLSELSFSSAYDVCQKIIKKQEEHKGA
ncbi:phytoene desaturase family protein [Evansella cellulosilytica]|uniref:FAD dependent oxidoreductase n=1 Tax=Evansella cellulosilytica (strain ATCC 21833 / DSM 2522 / FERM P-1141 / JCM 9156 / N-4) TaxID=649639 RepID=E6TXV1_EVAC2|nr:FAD-dependent oxidoreductase [Evansella cellulosilytica]ADU30027.1 FAD dependent oxidoreductase [Evansella cellulosilytica DSM 2522]